MFKTVFEQQQNKCKINCILIWTQQRIYLYWSRFYIGIYTLEFIVLANKFRFCSRIWMCSFELIQQKQASGTVLVFNLKIHLNKGTGRLNNIVYVSLARNKNLMRSLQFEFRVSSFLMCGFFRRLGHRNTTWQAWTRACTHHQRIPGGNDRLLYSWPGCVGTILSCIWLLRLSKKNNLTFKGGRHRFAWQVDMILPYSCPTIHQHPDSI